MPGSGNRAIGLRDLSELPGELRRACADYAGRAGERSVDPAEVRLPSKLADASIPLAKLGPVSVIEQDAVLKGIKVFESVCVRSGCLCFTFSSALLSAYASAAAHLLPQPSVGDEIMIPSKGCAADTEASGYVQALLIARYRAGKAHIDCPESRKALLHCLLTAGGEDAASAVRAALDASRAGKTGGIEAAAMAALLARQ